MSSTAATEMLSRWAIELGALFLRRSPSERGRYRIASALLPRLRQIGPRMGARIVRTRYGFRFRTDLADWLGQYVYLTGVYEPPTAALFAEFIKKGDTVLDIGANAGFFTLLSASLAGQTGRVVAFEPIPSVRDGLLANIGLNAFRNIEVVGKAVADKPATLTIYEGPAGHKGISSLRPLDSASRALTIDALALDEITDQLGRVSLIKIDVEGAEMLALLGMQRLVERDRPSFIVEFTDAYLKGLGHSAPQMAEWFVSRGYRIFRIDDGALVEFEPAAAARPDQYNVLACQTLPPRLAKQAVFR